MGDPSDYSTPPASGRSSPFHPQAQGSSYLPGGHRFADDLEGQNDEHLEGLTAKVKLLKDVSELLLILFLFLFLFLSVGCKKPNIELFLLYFPFFRSQLGLGTKSENQQSNSAKWSVLSFPPFH